MHYKCTFSFHKQSIEETMKELIQLKSFYLWKTTIDKIDLRILWYMIYNISVSIRIFFLQHRAFLRFEKKKAVCFSAQKRARNS